MRGMSASAVDSHRAAGPRYARARRTQHKIYHVERALRYLRLVCASASEPTDRAAAWRILNTSSNESSDSNSTGDVWLTECFKFKQDCARVLKQTWASLKYLIPNCPFYFCLTWYNKIHVFDRCSHCKAANGRVRVLYATYVMYRCAHIKRGMGVCSQTNAYARSYVNGDVAIDGATPGYAVMLSWAKYIVESAKYVCMCML